MQKLNYDHDGFGRSISPFRTPDLLQTKPAYVGPVNGMPLHLTSAHTLTVAVPLATDQGPAHLHRGDVVSSIGNTLIIGTILNGRNFFENWSIVHGTVDDFNQAGTVIEATNRKFNLGRPALLAPLLVPSKRSRSGESSYTRYEREALEVAGAQLYLSERVFVGASGLQERSGTTSGVYERLSPQLAALRPLLRGANLEDCGPHAEEDRQFRGEIGPDDKVYRFLLRTGSSLVARLHGSLYNGTTKSAGKAWFSASRNGSPQHGSTGPQPLLASMAECLPVAVNVAVSALTRRRAEIELQLQSTEETDDPPRISGMINDAIVARLVGANGEFSEPDITALTKLAFFWDIDPSRHFPQLHFWGTHFAAARFLGECHRYQGNGTVLLSPAAHWGMQALSFDTFDQLLDRRTAVARDWLRGFAFDCRDVYERKPARISLPGFTAPSWTHRATRKARGRP